MHGLGSSIAVRHFRSGRELPPLATLRSWSYAHQGNSPVVGGELRPGDQLTLTCTFNSLTRSNVTLEGPGTDDEMCMAWLSYYPAQEGLGMCFSLGGRPLAVCGDTMPPALQEMIFGGGSRSNASVVMRELVQRGELLQAPDPTPSAVPLATACAAPLT